MRIRHSEQKLTHQDYSSKSTSLVYLLDLLVWTIEFYHKMLNLISPRAMTFDVYKGRANIYSEIIFFSRHAILPLMVDRELPGVGTPYAWR